MEADAARPSRRRVLQHAALGAAALASGVGAGIRPAAAQTATIRTVAAWETKFLGIWNTHHNSMYLPLCTSLSSYAQYDLSYGVDANIAMFEATGKTQYLDRAIFYVDNVIATAMPSTSLGSGAFKDSYLGWISLRSDSTYGKEVPLFESYLWRYVARMLRLMKASDSIMSQSIYQEKYATILAFLETHIFDKWYMRSTRRHIYRENAHMASHWGMISLNLWMLTADSTRKSRCWTVFYNINNSLPNYAGQSMRKQLVRNALVPDAYFWSVPWGNFSTPGSDTPHANAVVAYIVDAQQLGYEWTRADADLLVNTLDKVIWPSSTRYSYYVDGSGTNSGWFNDGWCKLGRYSTALQLRLEKHNVGNNGQLWGNCCLNAKILTDSGAV